MSWTKEMAIEIIAAGYRAMSRKYHPDVGGKHEDMIALTATKEHLEQVLAGKTSDNHRRDANSYWSGMRDSARKAKERDEEAARRNRKSQYWSQAGTGTEEQIPIRPYEHDKDYFVLDDVTVMSLTEKAVKIKIPKVKAAQWLPKSQIHDDSEVCGIAGGLTIEGDVGYVIFTKWIAQQKGWLK